MMTYYKLSDINKRMAQEFGASISRQLTDYYVNGKDFPTPIINDPIRLWDQMEVENWLTSWIKRRRDK